jgi:putative tricarboxylic transport membrane protein
MLEAFAHLGTGFVECFDLARIIAAIAGVLMGTLAGVLPGLGISGTVAILLPFSYGMDSLTALILISGIFFGSQYGGAITSILVNIPGEATSIVTCFDGYPMAKQGRAGIALGIASVSSFLGGTFGIIALTFFAPILARFAVAFGQQEFFVIVLMGLMLIISISGKDIIKSAMMTCMGIMLGTIGLSPMHGTLRLVFGVVELYKGIHFIIFIMGVYGITELAYSICAPEDQSQIMSFKFRDLYPKKKDLKQILPTIGRGSIFGFLVGLIPGPGSMLATFGSYGIAKRLSKNPENFGKGEPRGVAAPESANNAAMYAQMVPLLSLGIPFSSGVALLMSGFMIHGIQPGPLLISQHPNLFWGLVASMFLGNIFLLIINLPCVGLWASLLKINFSLLMPVITIVTFTGAYAINNSVFDLGIMVVAGILGFFLKAGGYDLTALAIGLFLGPILENSLTSTMILYDGHLLAMPFDRPIAGTLTVITLLIIITTIVTTLRKNIKEKNLKRAKQ